MDSSLSDLQQPIAHETSPPRRHVLLPGRLASPSTIPPAESAESLLTQTCPANMDIELMPTTANIHPQRRPATRAPIDLVQLCTFLQRTPPFFVSFTPANHINQGFSPHRYQQPKITTLFYELDTRICFFPFPLSLGCIVNPKYTYSHLDTLRVHEFAFGTRSKSNTHCILFPDRNQMI